MRSLPITLALCAGIFLFFVSPVTAQTSATPSEVYQLVGWVRAEVELLRDARGMDETARDPGRQVNRVPLHVFAKANELRIKMARFQESIGMEPVAIAPLPFSPVTPGEVFSNVDEVLAEMRAIRAFLGIGGEVDQPAFIPDRTPSDVYRLLWETSYAFDAIAGQISPSFVLQNAGQIEQDIVIVAQALGSAVNVNPTAVDFTATPRDVIQESFVSMYLIGRLQRGLGMEPFFVPPIPGGAITPTNVFDTTVAILAEMHRIKVFLGVNERATPPPLNETATPTDVLMRMIGIREALVRLAAQEGGV